MGFRFIPLAPPTTNPALSEMALRKSDTQDVQAAIDDNYKRVVITHLAERKPAPSVMSKLFSGINEIVLGVFIGYIIMRYIHRR